MPLDQKKLEANLKKPVFVRVYRSIDSTNDEAKRRMNADRGITLYVSEHQTAGRGRRGHSFYSPQGSGLYLTLSLPVTAYGEGVQLTTCAAGVAVCEAISALSNRDPQIKWVNDIFIDGRKAAGILTELCNDEQNRPARLIVGIGINLTTEQFPTEIADIAGNAGDIDISLLCAEICNRLLDMIEVLFHHTDPEANHTVNSIIEKYASLNLCIGRNIRYTAQDGFHTALATAIDSDGSLIVTENGEKKPLRSGEISIALE